LEESNLNQQDEKRWYGVFFVAAAINLLCPLCLVAAQVTVDLAKPLIVSSFEVGTTYTHGPTQGISFKQWWEAGNTTAVANAKSLLVNGNVDFQVVPLMGWGSRNPEPSLGVYDWTDLNSRIGTMTSMSNHTVPVITFCTAPGWMKVSSTGGPGSDWNMDERVADEHVADFAELCKQTAIHFPQVQYFQVWNEMKGYWSPSMNNWDYIRYTTLYNAVYDAVKSVRPDAKIGGPYIAIQGDGGWTVGKSGSDVYSPIGSKDWTVINYWLANKHGADFFCYDYWLIDWHDYSANTYTEAEKMQLTHFFGDVVAQIRAVEPNLPIWISEFYGGFVGNFDNGDPLSVFTAANHASCYYHCLINDADLGLIWNPEQGEIANPLFTDTRYSSGGLATPHYNVVKAFNNNFYPGTQIYRTTTSTANLEALAALGKTLLINKSSSPVTATLDHNDISLTGYEVKVVNTRSGVVNFEDFAVFSSYYLKDTPCTAPDFCAGFDYNHSGTVDILDLVDFTSRWLLPIN